MKGIHLLTIHRPLVALVWFYTLNPDNYERVKQWLEESLE